MTDILVYIAGPYTNPDPVENTHIAVGIADRLLDDGYTPVIPHLTLFWHYHSPKPYEDWLEYDLKVMRRCDVVFRIPGASSGADAEVAEAEAIGLPVVYSFMELGEWRAEREREHS